jgi:hypothetical protein
MNEQPRARTVSLPVSGATAADPFAEVEV